MLQRNLQLYGFFGPVDLKSRESCDVVKVLQMWL